MHKDNLTGGPTPAGAKVDAIFSVTHSVPGLMQKPDGRMATRQADPAVCQKLWCQVMFGYQAAVLGAKAIGANVTTAGFAGNGGQRHQQLMNAWFIGASYKTSNVRIKVLAKKGYEFVG